MKSRIIKKVFPVCLILSLLILAFFIISRFQINKVIVITDLSDIYGLEIFNRNNLLFLNQDKAKSQFLKINPMVKSVSMMKQFPSTLMIQIESRKPVAKIISAKDEINVDSEGILLYGIRTSESLPHIEALNPINSFDDRTDWRILKAIKIIEETKLLELTFERILIDDEKNVFKLYSDAPQEIIIPFTADIPKIAASLQIIVSRFRIEGKFVTSVDFRFDKPVIKLASEEKKSSL